LQKYLLDNIEYALQNNKKILKISYKDLMQKSINNTVIYYVIDYINQKKMKVDILVVINQVIGWKQIALLY